MAGDSGVIIVEIMGTRLQLRGGEDPDAVKDACRMVHDQIEGIREHSPTAPSLQVALMTAINIADELIRVKSSAGVLDAAAQKASRILKKTTSVR